MLRTLTSSKGLARACVLFVILGVMPSADSGGARVLAFSPYATSAGREPRASTPEELNQTPETRRVIVVDPGHGGIDGGTSGAGLVEKNLTLDISRRIRLYLERDGFAVKMTRETDVDVSQLFPSTLTGRHKRDLQNRLDFIRQTRAVGSLSIHINSSTNPGDRGPIVFYAVHSEPGKGLAIRCQAAVNRVSGSTQRAVGRKNLFIIRHAPCPAVLVEVGFLTNQRDSVRLRDPQYLDQMARAIASAAAETLRCAPVPAPYVKGTAVNDWAPPT